MASPVGPPRVVNIEDLRLAARRRLPRVVFDYIDGGADDEITLRANCRAFDAVALRPRCAVATPATDLRTTVLGTALKGIARDRYILATKVGRYGHTIADFDFSAKRVTASVDESLARIGVDHIDLIQCHDIEFGDLDQIVKAVRKRLGE